MTSARLLFWSHFKLSCRMKLSLCTVDVLLLFLFKLTNIIIITSARCPVVCKYLYKKRRQKLFYGGDVSKCLYFILLKSVCLHDNKLYFYPFLSIVKTDGTNKTLQVNWLTVCVAKRCSCRAHRMSHLMAHNHEISPKIKKTTSSK